MFISPTLFFFSALKKVNPVRHFFLNNLDFFCRKLGWVVCPEIVDLFLVKANFNPPNFIYTVNPPNFISSFIPVKGNLFHLFHLAHLHSPTSSSAQYSARYSSRRGHRLASWPPWCCSGHRQSKSSGSACRPPRSQSRNPAALSGSWHP